MNICFHVDEVEKWRVCLANAYNTLRYFKDHKVKGHIDIIVNADAVKALTQEGAENAGITDEMATYINEGVEVKACTNALKGHGIDEAHLINGVKVVPSGIIELANRQSKGYAYIRP